MDQLVERLAEEIEIGFQFFFNSHIAMSHHLSRATSTQLPYRLLNKIRCHLCNSQTRGFPSWP